MAATIREVTYDASRHSGAPLGEEREEETREEDEHEPPGIDDVIGMPVVVCRTLQYVMMHTNAPGSPIHEAHFG